LNPGGRTLTSGIAASRPDGASPSAAALLRLADFSIDYLGSDGEVVSALRNVELEIREGEVLGVLGESGSGKSSLSNAILRLLPPNGRITSGRIEYRGKDLLALSQSELRQVRGAGIALISQEPALALNPVLTIGRQIIDVLRAHRRVSKEQAMEQTRAMLREIGFPDPDRISRAYPHQLSGGQRQRAAIAQSLICEPSLLVADEPLSSLDTITQAEILELLQKLKGELNLSMMFITHNAGVLSSLAERVAVIENGQMRACGTLDELSSLDDAYVRGLIFPEKDLGRVLVQPQEPNWSVTEEPFLRLRNVSKHFIQRHIFSRRKFAVQALQAIDFEIREGSTIAVIGRSGSGKTTLARCIAGFETPDSGEVSFAAEVANQSRGVVQLIFQDAGSALNPRFTAADAIAEPLVIARQASPDQRSQRVRQFMEEVGLDPSWASRIVIEFSGGQRQRIAIARALAASPRLLILDESLSGLDLPIQAQILGLLMDLQSRHGLTYLHITHDLNFLSRFADEVIVMDDGRIVERNTPAVLFQSTHPATRSLIEASERLHAPGLEVAQ